MAKTFLKFIGFTAVLLAVFLLSPLQSAKASAAENIRGLAYNATYGYISFNCLDDGYAGNFPLTFTFAFNIPPCSFSQHGVNLDDDNIFSGDAYNSALGYLTFSTASTTPDGGAFRSNCEKNVATSSACYREADGHVYGYLKIKSTGEWINLDDTSIPPTTSITDYNAPQPGIFSGYASSTFGSISFNCTDNVEDPNACTTNPYEVKIGPVSIRNMVAPNWNAAAACAGGASKAVLAWNRRGGVQAAYQVIVSTANSSSTNVVYNSGIVPSLPSTSQTSPLPLSYDTPYYWFLKLWDSTGSSTPWRQFNTTGTKDWISDNFARNSAKSANPNLTFTTYKHEFPHPSFTFSPAEISVATTSNSFVSTSNYFNDAGEYKVCPVGSVCTYNWTVSDPAATVISSTSASTSIMFEKVTSTTVTLWSTDDAIYTCASSTVLDINYALPLWKEIKAP